MIVRPTNAFITTLQQLNDKKQEDHIALILFAAERNMSLAHLRGRDTKSGANAKDVVKDPDIYHFVDELRHKHIPYFDGIGAISVTDIETPEMYTMSPPPSKAGADVGTHALHYGIHLNDSIFEEPLFIPIIISDDHKLTSISVNGITGFKYYKKFISDIYIEEGIDLPIDYS